MIDLFEPPRPAIVAPGPADIALLEGLVFPPLFTSRRQFNFSGTYASAGRAFRPVQDAGGQAGELMVVMAAGGAVIVEGNPPNPAPSILTPGGWSLVVSRRADEVESVGGQKRSRGLAVGIWRRVLTGGETASATFLSAAHPDSLFSTFRLRVYRWRWSGAAVENFSADGQIGALNPAAQTLPGAAAGSPCVMIAVGAAVDDDQMDMASVALAGADQTHTNHARATGITTGLSTARLHFNQGAVNRSADIGNVAGGDGVTALLSCLIRPAGAS